MNYKLPTTGARGRTLSLLISGLLATAAMSQGLQNYNEDGGLVRGKVSPTAVGAGAFGDQVNGYTGALSFSQVDVSLPGNSALPVEVRRGLTTGLITRSDASYGETPRWFADWELDIPHLRTYAPTNEGWQLWVGAKNAPENYQRCTYFGEELMIARSTQGSWVEPGFPVVDMRGFGGGGELMGAAGTYPTPSDGGQYPILTLSGWQVGCIPVAGPSGQRGEGFLAINPQGTRYRFDWLVSRRVTESYRQPQPTPDGGAMRIADGAQPESELASDGKEKGAKTKNKQGGVTPSVAVLGSVAIARSEFRLLPTLVTDRFGNWVRYNWDPQSPWRLLSITSSDGRTLSFNYTGNLISSVTDGSRTWQYTYGATSEPLDAAPTQLRTVVLPDGSQWSFSGFSLQNKSAAYFDSCDGRAPGSGGAQTAKVMTHPSGLVGEFQTRVQTGPFTIGLCKNEYGTVTGRTLYRGFGIATKKLYGPGVPLSQWTWGDYLPNASDSSTASYIVTTPQGYRTRHTYGSQYANNEGKLLKVEHGYDPASGTALRVHNYRYRSEQGQAFPARFGYSADQVGDGNSRTLNQPLDREQITQQGVVFTREVATFDALARASTVTRSGPGGSRTETTSYEDNTALWVMGPVNQVTSNGLVMVDSDYSPSTALLTATRQYGVLKQSFGYHSDGMLASKSDGANNTTYFGNYKRGVPQSVSYPTGASESAVVNDLGLITSVTGAAGYTTSYGYDAAGRLASITPPAGFVGTSVNFSPVAYDEFGLGAGHWRQTVTQGNAVTYSYFDAFWRPVMTRSFDAADEAGTRKVTVKQFDVDGRTTYESYPARDIAAYNSTPGGVRSTYDALGRPTQSIASSELGDLTTTTNYLSGFQTQTSNPRGKTTTQSLWALDDPGSAQLSTLSAPAGVTVSISRDAFGKPTAITRGGSFNGYTSNVTRRYVYDAAQRLCKTIEPEVGSTVQTYDAAGNVAWKATGQYLPNTAACDDNIVAANAKLVYGYDALNQLLNVSYGDGSPNVGRTYTADGLLQTITSNGSTWTYGYNALRQLATESLNYGGQNYDLNWAYNSQGKLSALTYPNGLTVSYSPNALGEARSVGGYASGITYHPNGAVSNFTFGNGIAHSLTLNARGLPLVNRDAGVMQDQYAYDANGNVASIADQQEGVFNRSMGYDDLDRLTSTSAPGVWGSAAYAYDPVDNLRAATVGSRSSSFNFDGNNQLASVTTNGSTINYSHDPRGNLASKGQQSFGFDIGNRLSWSSLGGSYAYDGHGRRFRVASSDGSTRIQVYSQQGQLLWATSGGGPRPSSSTAYVYLGSKQIAEVNSVSGTQYSHTDGLGSPVAHSNAGGALMTRTRFEPYGYVVQGAKPTADTSVIGFTGHVQDAETDLVYMQQRYYDPIAGRFLSVDPIVTEANTGKLFGRYFYAENNPYKYFDPNGAASTVIVNNNGYIIGTHAGVHVRSGKTQMLYDPGGSYKNNIKGSGDWLEEKDADLDPYVKFQKLDGKDVLVFKFDTTPEEEQQIRDRIEENGGCSPGLCSTCVGIVLRGIGPFANLGSSFTPAGLARELRRLQRNEAERKKKEEEEKRKREEKRARDENNQRNGDSK
jgi:RHS repeat-associated protein